MSAPYPHAPHTPWAFPCLPVTLYAVTGAALTGALSAEVDTGADTTLVPLTYLHHPDVEEIYTALLPPAIAARLLRQAAHIR